MVLTRLAITGKVDVVGEDVEDGEEAAAEAADDHKEDQLSLVLTEQHCSRICFARTILLLYIFMNFH